MAIEIYILPSRNPFVNLAIEEYFLLHHHKKKHEPILLFYENNNSIILGKSLRLNEEVFENKQDTIPIIRRLSGGGSVVHFIGNLNYTLILSLESFPMFFNIQESYAKIIDSICQHLPQPMKCKQMGISDIATLQSGRYLKISGNSQVRKNKFLLHHGTFVYNTKKQLQIFYYLKMPSQKPEYRLSRSHQKFMIKISSLRREEVMHRIIKAMSQLFHTTACIQPVDWLDDKNTYKVLIPIINRLSNTICKE